MADRWGHKALNRKYETYIHSDEWKEKAEERMELDGHICCVCGQRATEVHHLTYERIGNENMEDLVSLCANCHRKAEDIYDPAVTPWAMEEKKTEGNNFMAAMRVDADRVGRIVAEYLICVNGEDFSSLMRLRQPDDSERKRYWNTLKKAVKALCGKRYYRNCVEDRRDIALNTILNHTTVVLLAQTEHYARNRVQAELHNSVMKEKRFFGNWIEVAKKLGISLGLVKKLGADKGTSFGPSLREAVLFYCGMDAAAGIRPLEGFDCLTAGDYETLNNFADYISNVSGNGYFKGEN